MSGFVLLIDPVPNVVGCSADARAMLGLPDDTQLASGIPVGTLVDPEANATLQEALTSQSAAEVWIRLPHLPPVLCVANTFATQPAWMLLVGHAPQPGTLDYAASVLGISRAALLDQATTLFFAIDADGNVLWANSRLAELIGVSRDELVGQSWIEQCVPGDARQRLRAMLECSSPADSQQGSTITTRHDELRDIVWRLEVVRDVHGRVRGMTGVGRDASALREASSKLDASQQRYRELVRAVPDGIVVEVDGAIAFCNPAAALLLGEVNTKVLLGRPLARYLPAAALASWHAPTRDAPGPVSSQVELAVVRGDGTRGRAEASATVTVYEGHPGLLVVLRDLTERKRAARERRLLATAIDQLAEIIVITDDSGVVEYVNPAFERCTGYTESEAKGRHVSFLTPAPSTHDAHTVSPLPETRPEWMDLGPEDVWEGTFQTERKDGSTYEEEARISPVLDEFGVITHFVAVKRDASHEREMERRLTQSQRLESIGRLTGGIAHDFNNVLTGILSCAFFLLEDLDEGDPRREDAREIYDAAKHAADLTKQLFAFSRQQVLRPEVVELGTVLERMAKMLRRLLSEDIDLHIDVSTSLGRVEVDAGQFHQVVLNLVVNARDAMPDGGALSVSLRDHWQRDDMPHPGMPAGRYTLLTIADDGVGMDAAMLEHVFDPFFAPKGSGVAGGLGLSQVYGIVRQSNGYIDAQSVLGRGTRFRVFLPVVDEDISGSGPWTPLPGGSEHILLVEDDALVRRSLARMLTEKGYTVLPAATPSEAERIFTAHPSRIKLVVCDVGLPQMSGPELVERLRVHAPGLRAILISGHLPEKILKHFAPSDLESFISKPVRSHDLIVRVREVLNRTPSGDTSGDHSTD